MKIRIIAISILAVLFISSCSEDKPALPDNLVNFESDVIGFEETEASKMVNIVLSRNVDKECEIVVSLTETNLVYGQEYSTLPAAVDKKISVNIGAGTNSGSIKIVKPDGIFLSGNESLKLSILSIDESLIIGSKNEVTVSFASIVSAGSTMTIQGGAGGSSAVNSVFVDLSNNAQVGIMRKSWDLGFLCEDNFRVILNNTTGAAAIKLNKTDLASVTAADTIGLDLSVSTSNPNAMNIIDDVDGDLEKTVIGNISATPADNNVFIVNPGTSGGVAARRWKKIRVLRNSEGYTLQHANITDATFQTVQITKDKAFNFKFFSFESGIVNVEPPKSKWDFQWSGAIYATATGGTKVPYYFADLIMINNLAGVTVAEVLTSSVTYAAYAGANIATTTFSPERSFIGSKWRVTQGGVVGVKTDRFYVIKDSAGNVYKLRFLNFHASDGGVRGYPNIEYALVKKAN